jgi:hypothetical protein
VTTIGRPIRERTIEPDVVVVPPKREPERLPERDRPAPVRQPKREEVPA